MEHDITHHAKNRHSAKAYNPNKKISDGDVEKIKELLRYSPSSVNMQPWYFIVASSPEGKKRVAKSTKGLYQFNEGSILNASHVVVFCASLEMDDEQQKRILLQEEKDGRFASDPETLKAKMYNGRKMFINLHRTEFNDLQAWMQNQVYLNLGAFLLGVAALGLDATPMEGVETSVLDAEFGLREKGFAALAVVTIGYLDPEKDFNAKLPKSRLAYKDILQEV